MTTDPTNLSTTGLPPAAASGGGGGPRDRKTFKVGRVTIYWRDGSPNWWARYRENKKQRRESLKTANKKLATRRADTINERIILGPRLGPPPRAAPTFETAIDAFIRKGRLKGLKENTLSDREYALRQLALFAKARGITRLDELTVDVVESFQETLAKEGVKPPPPRETPSKDSEKRKGAELRPTPVSDWTVRRKLKIVKGFYRFAVRRGLIERNPVDAFDLPPEPKRQAHCYTEDEVKAIIAAVDTAHRLLFQFLPMSGLRSDEACHMEKVDCHCGPDEPLRRIRIREKETDQGRWKPKHGNERVVVLTEEAADVLRKALAASTNRWAFMPPTSNRGRPSLGRYTTGRVWRALVKAKEAAKVGRGNVHSFRHFYCSRMANAGVDAFAVMKLMGHSSLKIVLTYYHTTEQQLATAIRGGGVSFAALANEPATDTQTVGAAVGKEDRT